MNFFLALAANTLFYFGFQALFPTLPLYVDHLGGTPTDNGLVTLAFALTAVLSRPFLGSLTDRWGRKPLMLIGAVIFVASPLGYAASHTVMALLLARALQGIGIAAFTTAYQALIVDLAPAGRRGQSLGLSANSMALAFVTGPLAGDMVLGRWGFTTLFVLSAASAVGCAILTTIVRPPVIERAAEAPLWLDVRQVSAQGGLRAGLVGMAVLGVLFGGFMTFIPLYAQDLQLGTPGAFFTAYALALLAVQASAGGLSDRVGRARVATPATALAGVSILLLGLVRTTWMGWGAVFLYGLAAGAARVAIDGMVADSVPAHQRATAVALQFTCFDLWIGLGSVLLGPLAQAAGYPAMYAIAGALCIAGAIPFARLARRSSPVALPSIHA